MSIHISKLVLLKNPFQYYLKGKVVDTEFVGVRTRKWN